MQDDFVLPVKTQGGEDLVVIEKILDGTLYNGFVGRIENGILSRMHRDTHPRVLDFFPDCLKF
jgi:hypothetical protein